MYTQKRVIIFDDRRLGLENKFYRNKITQYGRSLLHSRFQCRHATLIPTSVSGEERCVTTLKIAV